MCDFNMRWIASGKLGQFGRKSRKIWQDNKATYFVADMDISTGICADMDVNKGGSEQRQSGSLFRFICELRALGTDHTKSYYG